MDVEGNPIFCKRRPLAVEKELKKLSDESIILPESAETIESLWISIRFSMAAELEDSKNHFSHAKVYSKIDLQHAFLQIPLGGESRKLTTINTPFGLFQYNFLSNYQPLSKFPKRYLPLSSKDRKALSPIMTTLLIRCFTHWSWYLFKKALELLSGEKMWVVAIFS